MNIYLMIAAVLNAIAAALHIGCIVFGAPWYRFLGAGKRMVDLADSGSVVPAITTLIIVLLLSASSIYTLSAAGVIQTLPFLRVILAIITAVYVVRGVAGFFLILYPVENSPAFWLWSSMICLVIGLFHLVGLILQWPHM